MNHTIPGLARYIIFILPVLALIYAIYIGDEAFGRLFESVPIGLIIFGSAGQIIFTFRFIYQWWYSRARNESLLPATFWRLSIFGSPLIVSYGISRRDPVLIFRTKHWIHCIHS